MPSLVPTVFVRAAASVTLTTTLATVTTGKKWVVTNVVVTNTAASSATFDLALDGIKIASGVTIPANSITVIDLKQIIDSAKLIQGGASATTVNFHISGVEIS